MTIPWGCVYPPVSSNVAGKSSMDGFMILEGPDFVRGASRFRNMKPIETN
jgi:hypothetical protein